MFSKIRFRVNYYITKVHFVQFIRCKSDKLKLQTVE